MQRKKLVLLVGMFAPVLASAAVTATACSSGGDDSSRGDDAGADGTTGPTMGNGDGGPAGDASSGPFDAGEIPTDGSPFAPTTTLFPANLFLDPTLPCEAGTVGDAAAGSGQMCCGAASDGSRDVTAILQACIDEGPVFLPAGTYLVSQTLGWSQPYGQIQGENRATTTLKLADHAPAFQSIGPGDAGEPCVLSTSGHPTGGPTYWVSTAFNNFLENFTVDIGSGNPAACGIQFHGNNVDDIRDVTVTADDDGGSIGIDMTHAYPGPSMLSGVEVAGFATGIGVAYSQYGITFEHISVHGQSVYGMDVADNVVSIRDLESSNNVPAIHAYQQGAFVTLIDSYLAGGAASASAIVNEAPLGSLFLRNVATSGYGSAVSNRGATVPGPITEYIDSDGGAPVTLVAGPTHSLALPIEETPSYHDNDLTHWQDVGPASGKDDTAAIQAAMNAGKPVVYFRKGDYFISDTITVPATVKQVIGNAGSFVNYASPNNFTKADAGPPYKAAFSVEGGEVGDQVFLEKLMFRGPRDANDDIGVTNIVDNTPRTLVIRDTTVGGGYSAKVPTMGYLTGTSTSPVFFDNVGMQAHFSKQTAWIRQYDTEGAKSSSPAYYGNANDGATVWILGLKTENTPVVMATTGGGKTEILGGLLYTISDNPNLDGGALPAFSSVDSALSLTFVEELYDTANIYSVYVDQTDDGVKRSLLTSGLPYHRDGTAHRMPLFVGQ